MRNSDHSSNALDLPLTKAGKFPIIKLEYTFYLKIDSPAWAGQILSWRRAAHNATAKIAQQMAAGVPRWMKGGMTRLIFIPDRKTFILQESPLPAEELAASVLRGHWCPPAPYGWQDPRSWRVSQQGQVVVVTLDESRPAEGLPAANLSPRQLEVLQCLVEGLTNKQIARRLGMSARTVFNHQAALKDSLQASTLVQAAALGAVLGLCQPMTRLKDE
jgi:DNA-binding CsgD family transcriptional regulator